MAYYLRVTVEDEAGNSKVSDVVEHRVYVWHVYSYIATVEAVAKAGDYSYVGANSRFCYGCWSTFYGQLFTDFTIETCSGMFGSMRYFKVNGVAYPWPYQGTTDCDLPPYPYAIKNYSCLATGTGANGLVYTCLVTKILLIECMVNSTAECECGELIVYGTTYTIGTETSYSIGSEQYDNVYSTDPDTYPHDGYQDGYYYVLVTD